MSLSKPKITPAFWTHKYAESQDGRVHLAGVDVDSPRFTTEDPELCQFLFLYGIENGLVLVPRSAPYGGAWADEPGLNFERAIEIFINSTAKIHKASRFQFVFPARRFADDVFDTQIDFFRSRGATTSHVDASQGINVNKWELEKCSKGNRKKLRQFLEAGGVFRRAEVSELPDIYEIIRLNRENIGVTPSISLEQLQKSFALMPSIYSAWVATIDGSIAAVAITLRVKHDNEYVYMWADNLAFRNFSPIVAICEGLISVTKCSGVTMLDLGISSVRGVVNENLFRFKSNLGADSYEKPTFVVETN